MRDKADRDAGKKRRGRHGSGQGIRLCALLLALLLTACGSSAEPPAPEETPEPEESVPAAAPAVQKEKAKPEPPVILAQPAAACAPVGTDLVLSVEAAGEALHYQWQLRADEDSDWMDCRGAGSDTAAFTLRLRSYHDGYRLRCLVSNDGGEILSEEVTVRLQTAPQITRQPHDCVVAPGDEICLLTEASGGDLQYQWYYRSSSGSAWTPCGGEYSNRPEYRTTAKNYHSGYQYRCEVSNPQGRVYSDIAMLTVVG